LTPARWQQARTVFEHASGLPVSERAVYLANACAGDPDLLHEVESLLASEQLAGAKFLEQPAVDLLGHGATESEPVSRVSSRVGPYQLIELLGTGGMGEVYRAKRVDGQYEAEVAVKLVRSGINSDVIAERLRHERQILAGLENPNIARLLDGGTTPTGTPYLVMELVNGTAIDEFCDARRLSVTERLKLFRRVCEAVGYAHRRLIIHRDIKPSNILVTPDGQPKLLDFGIARLLDPTVGAPATVMQAMTPEYASPEQFKGVPITTATDVYSLGVVLYRLLTGESPYPTASPTPHSLMRAVCELIPARPSLAVTSAGRNDLVDPGKKATGTTIASAHEGTPAKLQRRLAGDLDQIILKAMSKDPEGRYGSVEQFSEDIERHLLGLPVRASRGSWRYRARKFVGRHRGTLAAAAIVFLTLLAGLMSTIHQTRLATANGRRAEQRFDDVRHLATSFLFEFHDAIRHLPGSTTARALVVKRALEYLNSLSQEAGDDPALRRELATAYVRLADVQGAPMRNSLGDYPGALQSIHKATTILEALHRASPGDGELSAELGHAYSEMANLLDATGSSAAALEGYRKGLAVIASIQRPGLKAQKVLTHLYVGYGDGLAKSGDLPAAVESYRKAIATDDEILRVNPGAREFARDQAVAYIHLGDGYANMRKFPEALASAKSAYELFASLVTPNNAQSRRDLGVANTRIAEQLANKGDTRGALAIQQRALESDLEAARNDPRNHLPRRDVYIDYFKIARLQSDLGQMKDAIVNARRVIELAEAEDAAAPGSSITQDDLQEAYSGLSQMLHQTRDHRGALGFAQKAQRIVEASVKENPQDLAGRSTLAEIKMSVSDAQLALGQNREALAGYLAAVAISESVVASDPSGAERRVLLARLYERLGDLFSRRRSAAGGNDDADSRNASRSYYRKSLAIWSDLEQHQSLGAAYAGEPAKVARALEGMDPVHGRRSP